MCKKEREEARLKRVKVIPSLASRKEDTFTHSLLALAGGHDTLMVFSCL